MDELAQWRVQSAGAAFVNGHLYTSLARQRRAGTHELASSWDAELVRDDGGAGSSGVHAWCASCSARAASSWSIWRSCGSTNRSTLKERAPGWLHARGVPVVASGGAPPLATSELLAADNTVEGGGLRIIRASQLRCRVLLQGLPGATFFIVAPCCSVPHHPGFWEDATAFGSAAVAARD